MMKFNYKIQNNRNVFCIQQKYNDKSDDEDFEASSSCWSDDEETLQLAEKEEGRIDHSKEIAELEVITLVNNLYTFTTYLLVGFVTPIICYFVSDRLKMK